MASTFPSEDTSSRYWRMSGLFSFVACTVISSGSRWYTHEMSMTSREMVAENIPRFFRLGILSRIRVTSWIKPMSSIRSASSSTTVCTLFRLTVRRFMWSLSRPGVATTICGLRFSASICLPMGCPPYRHTRRTPSWQTAMSRISSVICMASSRVGARITACTSSLSRSMRSIMGMPNAMVLPVPVGALAMTSFPASMGGMHPACTGVLTA